jgi:hypothetical protein
MSQGVKNTTWHSPSECLPTFADGPRRFGTKVEVEVECQLGVERRNFFVGGGFDDNDIIGKGVIRWRPVATIAGSDFRAFLADKNVWSNGVYVDDVLIVIDGNEFGDDVDLDNLYIHPDANVEIQSGDVMHAGERAYSLLAYYRQWAKEQGDVRIVVTVPHGRMDAVRAAIEAAGGIIS